MGLQYAGWIDIKVPDDRRLAAKNNNFLQVRRIDLGQPADEIGMGHDDLGARIVQNMLEQAALVSCVDWNVGGTQPIDPKPDSQTVNAVG